jgi:EAL and modified HD-GYP domain-containing signal transduction protein
MAPLVARTPILDERNQVLGYSLDFRGAPERRWSDAGGGCGPRSSRRAFGRLGLAQLAGAHRVFLPFSPEQLLAGAPRAFSRDDVAVAVNANGGDARLTAALVALAADGYAIALDLQGAAAPAAELLTCAQYALIDPLTDDTDGHGEVIRRLRAAGVEVIARGVEDASIRERAAAAGCTLFAGAFLSTSSAAACPVPPPRRSATMLALIAELNEPDFDLERAQRLIRTDPALAYLLLRYINSAFFSLPREVGTIREAVTLLGSDHIRRFVSIIALARIGEDRPEELLRTAIVRALLAELLAPRRGPELFTLGLFSILDVLLGLPMDQAVVDLPLTEELIRVLVDRRGPLAPYLALACGYHAGCWDQVTPLVRRLKLDERRLPGHYREAIGWADAVFDASEDE